MYADMYALALLSLIASYPLATLAAVGDAGVPMATPSGTYTPSTNVRASADLSSLVANIKSSISDAEWAEVRTLYSNSALQVRRSPNTKAFAMYSRNAILPVHHEGVRKVVILAFSPHFADQ